MTRYGAWTRTFGAAAVALACGFGGAAGCGGETGAAGADAVDAAAAGADAGTSDADAAAGSTGDTAGVDDDVEPADAAAAVLQPPAPFKYSGGTCPKLGAGANKFTSWGKQRTFDVYLPAAGGGQPGLLFLWHGLGDTKENFGAGFAAAQLAGALGVIVVVPQAVDKVTGWGWGEAKDADEDGALFDDLLRCVDDQYDIDNARVYTMGFSSGALWSTWLTLHRSSFLAAAVIWSGGSSKTINVYKSPKRTFPVIVAWGGTSDEALLKFEPMAIAYADGLQADGHFVLRCNHKLGHTVPQDGLAFSLQFLAAHTWHTTGRSPLQDDPAALAKIPKYCEIPKGP